MNSSMKPYPAYRDSGIEWMGNVPEHWNIIKLKHISNIVNGSTPKSSVPEYWDGDIAWVTPYDLGNLDGRLIKKLPRKDISEMLKLDDEVALEYYRLQKISEGSIPLQKEDGELDPASEMGMRKEKEELAHLSEIIKVLNDRFGTDFTDADRLFFEQIEADLVANEDLSKQARNNTIDNFKFGFEDIFIDTLIGRMDQNEDIFAKIMDDTDFATKVKEILIRSVYRKLNEENAISSA
ncbi:MAG: hypothetical protein U9N13_01260 [Euryarchaeota archaeon]|nr:hypothetical protein [Euryarchaeota archaeon]